MYVLYFLAKKNLKKKKGDVAVLLILTSLATLLLYTSISALTQTSQVIEAAFECRSPRGDQRDFDPAAGNGGI